MMKRRFISLAALLLVAVSVLALSGGGSANPGGDAKPPGKIVSDDDVFTAKQIDNVELKAVPEETLPSVGDKETLLKLLKERGALHDMTDVLVKNYDNAGTGIPDAVPAEPGAPVSESDAGGHSETNEQVAGVNEGDIVKTDGTYIYALADNKLRIIAAAGMELVSVIELGDGIWGSEFYLIGDKLAVVAREFIAYDLPMPMNDVVEPIASADLPPDATPVLDSAIAPEWIPQRDFSLLMVYDITDRSAPVETRRVEMDGWSVATRVIGDTVYMVTNKSVWGIPYNDAGADTILPFYRDTAETFEPVAYDDIYYIPGSGDSSYLLVGSLNVNGDEPFEPTAYLGAGSQLYMSANAMYLTQTRYGEGREITDGDNVYWEPSPERTEILRFDVADGQVLYSGSGTVDGSPISQYSMDEYDGFFRIATTAWNAGTYVTVLDADMNTVGRVGPLMPEERMQSMRFMGDLGYIVTFQNTDPLFTIDLSDPYNPTVLGELKIPGFSQYLHPVGDGLLLGIGRDTQELFTRDEFGVETVIGAQDVGLKVSLFDVSDPYNPREADVLRLGEGYAEVSYNPRALMCDSERGLYGFIMDRWNSANSYWSAIILRVENGRLSTAADLSQEGKSNYNNRLCFIGDTLYLINGFGITAYDYNTFAELTTLSW